MEYSSFASHSRPYGALVAKIDEIFPCNSLWLLLRSLVIANLDIVEHRLKVKHYVSEFAEATMRRVVTRLPIFGSGNSFRLFLRLPRFTNALPGFCYHNRSRDLSLWVIFLLLPIFKFLFDISR